MNIETAIKYFEQEIRFCENAPVLNGCEMTEDWLLTKDACKLAVAALKNLRVLESNFRVKGESGCLPQSKNSSYRTS